MSNQWNPYPIPAAPTVGVNENWALGLKNGATGGTNPSKFFQWKKIDFPNGNQSWQMLYWDGNLNGVWRILKAPEDNNTALTFKDNKLQWGEVSFPDGEKKWEMLYWNPDGGEGADGAWEALEAPKDNNTVLTFKDDELKWGGVLPDGGGVGDLLYWDLSAGEGGNGAWVVLTVPEATEEDPVFLYWNGSDWNFAEIKKFVICENGTPTEYKIPTI